ncbi:MAG TPA: elongation factor P [Candidatus Saccharimonadales bacterium]|nr:elongation factor P [Candidatus Saccharimonadales bacterium]
MIGVTDLRAGTAYEEDGQFFTVLSYEHIKMGRGSANIKLKVKNLKTGAIVDKSYINGAKMHDIQVLKKDMQYLYKDDDAVYFMDPESFEQVSIPIKIVPEHIYLKEGESFTVSFLDGEPLTVLLPPKMTFKVAETAPGAKGNSATNVFKEAILENGLKTRVPLFINIGEMIRVDTRTGAYSEKA